MFRKSFLASLARLVLAVPIIMVLAAADLGSSNLAGAVMSATQAQAAASQVRQPYEIVGEFDTDQEAYAAGQLCYGQHTGPVAGTPFAASNLRHVTVHGKS
jgi:hypothetical protein